MNLCGGEGRGLVLGLALLLWVSCEEPARIGIDVDPDNLDFATHYELVKLESKMVQIDSIPTTGTTRILVGRYNDPYFGISEAKSFTQIWTVRNPSIPEDALYDSLVLNLKYDYEHGEDITGKNKLLVYRLTEDLVDFAVYYTTSETSRSDSPIGEGSFRYVTDFDDTETVVLDTAISIRLVDDLGETIFNMAKDPDDTIFSNLNNWLNFFKGISLEADTEFSTITGFLTVDSRTNMSLHYHFEEDDGDIINRTYLFTMEPAVNYSNISYDRTGTAIEGIDESYVAQVASDSNIYIQAGTGLVAKIDFSPILEFADTIEFIAINTAILTLGSVEPYNQYVIPPEKLIYFFTDSINYPTRDSQGFRRAIQEDNPTIDPNGTRAPIESSFIISDPDKDIFESYSDRISSFVQGIIDGYVDKHEVLAYPSTVWNSKTVDRLLLDPENINLEIYYTTTKGISSSE